MSIEAMQWSFAQAIKPSSVKFVLISLADHAQAEGYAWPSITSLVAKTSQDRKTVISALDKLEKQGFLLDSGKRFGVTKQVKVYQFNFSRSNNPANGTVPKTEQSRNFLETVPDFPEKSTVFPDNSTVFPPKSTENGTRKHKEPSLTIKEPKKKQKKASEALAEIALPDWLSPDDWQNWIAYRESIGRTLTDQAAKLCIAKLTQLRDKGNDPVEVINRSIMSGKWHGLFGLDAQQRGSPQGYESNKDRSRRQTIEGLTGRKPDGRAGTIIDIN